MTCGWYSKGYEGHTSNGTPRIVKCSRIMFRAWVILFCQKERVQAGNGHCRQNLVEAPPYLYLLLEVHGKPLVQLMKVKMTFQRLQKQKSLFNPSRSRCIWHPSCDTHSLVS
jgi:hypothetical protein